MTLRKKNRTVQDCEQQVSSKVKSQFLIKAACPPKKAINTNIFPAMPIGADCITNTVVRKRKYSTFATPY